jgi:hypothetical protein
MLLATLVILGSVDEAWVILGERFRALLAEVAEQMPAEHREQAMHYWAYGEWELAADYFSGLHLTPEQRAALAVLVKDANERFEAMQGPWWKRMFRR